MLINAKPAINMDTVRSFDYYEATVAMAVDIMELLGMMLELYGHFASGARHCLSRSFFGQVADYLPKIASGVANRHEFVTFVASTENISYPMAVHF